MRRAATSPTSPLPLNWFDPAYLAAQKRAWRQAAESRATSKLAAFPIRIVADFYAGAALGRHGCSQLTQPLVGAAFYEPRPSSSDAPYAAFCAAGGALGWAKTWLPGPVSYLVGLGPGLGVGLINAAALMGSQHTWEVKKLYEQNSETTFRPAPLKDAFVTGALTGFFGTLGVCRAVAAALLGSLHVVGRLLANTLQLSAALALGVLLGLYGVGRGIYTLATMALPCAPASKEHCATVWMQPLPRQKT